MFFRATIRRLFPVVCATVMLCASAVAHVPRAPVPRIALQVAQPALAGHWPPNLVTDTGTPVIHADPLLDAATHAITNLVSPAVHSGVAVAGYDTDFFGAPRNPTNPCLGAIEFDGGGAPIIPGGVTISTASIVRDGGGRIIRRTYRGRVQNLAYDGRGRLTAWDWGGSTSNATPYTYDHAGRRVLITETLAGRTTVTRCVYDGADVCTDFVDSNNDGAVDRTRVYWLLPGMDRRIGFADITNGVATFYYYITDQVGSVLQIVNDAGTVVNQYDYDAWGNVRWGGSNTFERVENRYLFQGREWDKNGGFYYFRNRIYLPERGEFASPDRNLGRGILGEMDGMGTLVFGGGDPVNNVDPTGLCSRCGDLTKTCLWNDDRNFVDRWMSDIQTRALMQRESVLQASRDGKIESGETTAKYVLLLPANMLAAFVTLPKTYMEWAKSQNTSGRIAGIPDVGAFFADGVISFVAHTGTVIGEISVERSGENIAKSADVLANWALIMSMARQPAKGPGITKPVSAESELTTLYHGTSKEYAAAVRANGIDLNAGRANLDFGKGFYTTTDAAQAAKWASRFSDGGEVLQFNVPTSQLNGLNGLSFASADASWANFVRGNRLGGAMHDFDYISGPMLGRPGPFLKGGDPVAWGQQTSFHTQAGADLLTGSLVK